MEKTPETTIATLDLGSSCLLTLTNKHLRGQITRYVEVGRDKNGNPIVRLQKDSLDVLLSGIAGYSLDFQNMKGGRITNMVFGILFTLVGCYVGFEMISWGFAAIPVGILWFLYGLKFPKDIWAFSINVMGGKNQIPVAEGHTELVREFITKLQNAKIAYDEGNA